MTSNNFELDFAQLRASEPPVARVCIALACSYVKDGGAPTVTEDCDTHTELGHEVERLKNELDSILAQAEARFAGSVEAPSSQPQDGSAGDAASTPKPRLGDDLLVRDLMTRDVKTVDRNAKLSVAEELMKVGRFRHVVVLDDEGKVSGVVSQRDLVYSAISWSLGQGRAAHQKGLDSFPVKNVMDASPETTHPDTPVSEAASKMMERKIGCLPVVDAGRLVGILTEGDFLGALAGA